MKTPRLLFALACATLIPAFASAQTPAPTPDSGTVTGSSSTTTPGTTGQPDHRGFGLRKLMQGITLSDTQQQQIDQLTQQFRQEHQPGTPRDPQAMQTLRTSVENVLTPAQRTQFENNIAEMRANFQKNKANGTTGNGGPPGGGPFTPDASPSPNPPV